MAAERLRILIAPDTCIVWALMLLVFPLPWILSWFFAAFVHEVCHCLAVVLCGYRLKEIALGAWGAQILTEEMPPLALITCVLAGPIGGLLLTAFSIRLPIAALCALIQSSYNLLPIYPLDGGRALKTILCTLFSEERGEAIFFVLEQILLWTATLLCVYLAISTGYILFCMLPWSLWLRKIKIPCKTYLHRVQ